ncbi:hypothetical protein M406DRAFT_284470 [Cryphonectria parasitica EP155]|uniref:Cytoplasmic tRNA 2-thiolation protein 2 n=1 Tax=Cryphonectria parasitica (strain ATCC 38755 / EP155) TaxID=660469 RepID=A0A9P5CTZ8_CRYP1|nr:uncharacterized protein M406DRAFT_284470 [Cryphonectria parasitica EP155]KAF3769971.1 hypothetical protein M406DRAFT_284470 [Cryphonectria parasitica EP155]
MKSHNADARLCRRCNETEVTLKIRAEAICSPCYRRFVNHKTVKRLEVLAKEISAAPTQTKRILVGLSHGASSAALIDILNTQLQNQLRRRPSAAFEIIAVHVDTDLLREEEKEENSSSSPASQMLQRCSTRYPQLRFSRVPLARVLSLDTVDWAALPSIPADQEAGARTAEEKVAGLLDRLPSTTSRTDITRLFVRHVLIDAARREGCCAVLLGCSTTALAELTLGETAKGRGFSLPWMVGDGPLVVARFPAAGSVTRESSAQKLSVYYPNRDLFRSELIQYASLAEPPLTDLICSDTATGAASSAVVSHKDVSIDSVMRRYFADVEENYPSIVANVVRTTAKLERRVNAEEDEEERHCGLCGMGLDELGDERWKGEMGDDGSGKDGRLCYGCSRAVRG